MNDKNYHSQYEKWNDMKTQEISAAIIGNNNRIETMKKQCQRNKIIEHEC
jgi:hypothetical protein